MRKSCEPIFSLKVKNVFQFKNIRNQLDEERQMDILKQCYHFMLAFHNVPKVVTDLSAIIVALNGNSKQVSISSILPICIPGL